MISMLKNATVKEGELRLSDGTVITPKKDEVKKQDKSSNKK